MSDSALPVIYDLTQPLNDHTPYFPGDTRFQRQPLPNQHPWQVSSVAMSSHSGTHLDAPLHRIPGGLAIDDLPLERLIGPGQVLDATGYAENEPIPATLLDTLSGEPAPGWIALIRTGWDRFWRDERYFQHPFLSPDLAQRLVASGCGLVAIDALSVDSTVDEGDAAHVALLGQGVLIAENLRGLEQLHAGGRYMVSLLPLRMAGSDGSPIRCVAWDPDAR